MLSKIAQEKVLKALKLTDASIAELMKDGEFDVEIPSSIHVFDDAGLDELKKNTRTNHTPAALEILAKQMMKDFGIEIDKKDPIEVAKAYALREAQKAVDAAKLPTDDQIKSLNTSIEALRKNFTDKELEVESFKKSASDWEGKFNSRIESEEVGLLLPENRVSLLNTDQWREKIAKEHGVFAKKVNGVFVATDSEGKVIKDKLEKDVLYKDKVLEVFEKSPAYVVKKEESSGGSGSHAGGNSGGGGDSGGTEKIRTLSELKARAVVGENGKQWDQRRLKAEYAKAALDPEFDANS